MALPGSWFDDAFDVEMLASQWRDLWMFPPAHHLRRPGGTWQESGKVQAPRSAVTIR